MRNPLASTGWLLQADNAGTRRFVGTCFAFRHRHWLLTAAHCVSDAPVNALCVVDISEPHRERPVIERIMHPHADLALLRVDRDDSLSDVFLGETSVYDWGEPVSAFGYPEDTGDAGPQPTPRYFRGNLQRMFRYRSHLGYEYEAAELSFGAPAGLSGGPVTPASDYANPMGLVAENKTSSTYLSSITEVQTDSSTYSERIHSVINYAIVVRLDPLSDWLNSHVPYPGVSV